MNTKIFKRVLCMLLAIIMVASLGACSGGTTTVVESEVVIEGDDNVAETPDNGTADDATASENDKTSSDKNTSSKDNASSNKNTSSKDKTSSAGKTSSESKPTENKTPSGEFDPYAGIEDYKGKTVTLATWWKLTKFEQQAVNDFQKKYGIKVKLENTTLETYVTKITSQISSGQAPDLCAIKGDDYLTFIQNNLVQPITAGKFDIERDKKLDLSTMKALSWKGNIYGINLANNMTYSRYVIYYNKDMFDNAGLKNPYKLWKEGNWNWETFADYAKKMTTRSGNKTIYGYTGLDTTIEGWLLTNNTHFITSDGNKLSNNLTSQKVQETLTFISGLREAGYWCPDESTAAFMNGEAAMMGDGSWMFEADCQPKVNYGAVPLPCPKGSEEVITHGSTLWAIATGAKEPIAASYFIRYWLDFDNHNIKKAIPLDEAREVFEYMSDTSKNRKTGMARSVAGFYQSSQYWVLLNISRESANDIPVELKKQEDVINGIIAKIDAK